MENCFAEHITNEEVAELPVCRFGGRIVVIDSEEGVQQACAELMAADAIGFDTETRPSFKAGVVNKTALLQLSTDATCYLFRLNKMKLERAILKVLESKKVVKVGADIKNDLRGLQALSRFRPAGFVDLQSVGAEWGVEEKSVRKMSGIVLGMRVSKAQRLSNWEASELTEAQQQYAATDAWVCLEMYRRLNRTEKKKVLGKEIR